MLASERIVAAALTTTHRGLVFVRNHTLSQTVDTKCINSLTDALHEVPAMVQQLQNFRGGEEQLLQALRTHLACFEYSKWPGSPNLLAIFEQALAGAP
jgi:hypothetical protein